MRGMLKKGKFPWPRKRHSSGKHDKGLQNQDCCEEESSSTSRIKATSVWWGNWTENRQRVAQAAGCRLVEAYAMHRCWGCQMSM